MADFHVKIISSNRTFYEGVCHCLILPAVDGEMAVMAHHESEIVAVKAGEMRFQATEDGPWEAAVVGQGFCEIQQPCYVAGRYDRETGGDRPDPGAGGIRACERAAAPETEHFRVLQHPSGDGESAGSSERDGKIRKLGISETDLSLFYACE